VHSPEHDTTPSTLKDTRARGCCSEGIGYSRGSRAGSAHGMDPVPPVSASSGSGERRGKRRQSETRRRVDASPCAKPKPITTAIAAAIPDDDDDENNDENNDDNDDDELLMGLRRSGRPEVSILQVSQAPASTPWVRVPCARRVPCQARQSVLAEVLPLELERHRVTHQQQPHLPPRRATADMIGVRVSEHAAE
jgi:hypothetical protein